MKNFIVFLGILILAQSSRATLTADGIYQGRNLYIQNPLTEEGTSCVDSVYLNGSKLLQELNPGAFEIDFTILNFKVGDSIHLVIYHNSLCRPKILNPHHGNPRTISPVKSILVSKDSLFLEVKDMKFDPLYLEIYRWNKWVIIDTISQSESEDYAFPLIKVAHGGPNKFRIRYPTALGIFSSSNEVTYQSSKKRVELTVEKSKRTIAFSSETFYEVYTVGGIKIISGYGDFIDLNAFTKEQCDGNNTIFYLNLDNRNEKLRMHRH